MDVHLTFDLLSYKVIGLTFEKQIKWSEVSISTLQKAYRNLLSQLPIAANHNMNKYFDSIEVSKSSSNMTYSRPLVCSNHKSLQCRCPAYEKLSC